MACRGSKICDFCDDFCVPQFSDAGYYKGVHTTSKVLNNCNINTNCTFAQLETELQQEPLTNEHVDHFHERHPFFMVCVHESPVQQKKKLAFVTGNAGYILPRSFF